MVKRKVLTMAQNRAHLESGAIAKVSGLYGSDHKECSRASIWVQRHHKLPDCMDCGKSIRFTLLKKVQHISEDVDFQ